MIGARKGFISTPVGYFPIPEELQAAMDRTSDVDLLGEYIQKCKQFVEPNMLNELAYRGLIKPGMYYKDCVELYEKMKGDTNATD